MPTPAQIIQLVQINQPFLQRDYLPYAAGLLQAYCLRHAEQPGRLTFLPPWYRRTPLAQALEQAVMADVLGLSIYVWNEQWALALARAYKQRRPDGWVIAGGPQVPDRAETWLRSQPAVDLAVHGEGEATFLTLLEAGKNGDLNAIDGISYWAEGQFYSRPRGPRLQDLDSIPSPYLLGLFDPLLKERPGSQWVALWETNRGCPFSCAFCDWGSATQSKVYRFGEARLHAEIAWFARQGIHLLYCCDANYGLLPRDEALTAHVIAASKQHNAPQAFYIQNTKNATERAYRIQQQISQAGLNQAVTLSLQSVTPAVLSAIQRDNISLDTYRELQHRFAADGVQTYTDMLVGLPGDDLESFAKGVQRVIREGQHNLIRFYNVYLLPNAEMAQPAYRAQHGLETVITLYAEPFGPVQSEIPEYQELVVATATLSREDWRRCRMLAWWYELLYFNRRLLQLPLFLLDHVGGLGYAEVMQHYLEGDWPTTQVLGNLRAFLQQHVSAIQAGEPELCRYQAQGQAAHWLSPEDFLVNGLTQSGAWEAFFTITPWCSAISAAGAVWCCRQGF